MAFVSHDTLRYLLAQEPCPLAVLYWGQGRLTLREARHALTTLHGHERVLVLGRFAYVEALYPGRPESRAPGEPAAPAHTTLCLADIWTDPTYAQELEQRILAALEGPSLTIPAMLLMERTLLPHRTLAAICYALEEQGLLRVLARGNTSAEAGDLDFSVCRAAPPAPRPPSESGPVGALRRALRRASPAWRRPGEAVCARERA